MIHRFDRYKIDPAKHPILIYPTLHYQNGGIQIDSDGRTEIKGLWASGEVAGGIHGTNRLMGNSLLDITVFGRRAALSAQSCLPPRRSATLTRLKQFKEKLKNVLGQRPVLSPLLFPVQTRMKISFDKQKVSKVPNADLSSTSRSSFDPPDPFAN